MATRTEMETAWAIDLTVYDAEEGLLAGLRRRDLMACAGLLKPFVRRL